MSTDKASEARFRKAIQKLVALSGEPVEDILKKQGRLFAVDASKFTRRFGNKKSSGVQHKEDVKNTIFSVYVRPLTVAKMISIEAGEKTGRRFSNYIRRRDVGKAKELIDLLNVRIDGFVLDVGNFDNGKRHKSRLMGRSKKKLVVMDWTSVTSYAKKEVANVGEAKHGWAVAARMLGGDKEIPLYAKKNHKTRGLGRVTGRGGKAELTVANYSKHVLVNSSLSKLWALRAKKTEAVIEWMIKRQSKKITRKT